MKQLPLALTAQPLPTLGNFVVGANPLLLSHLRALPGQTQSPAALYLWGDAGCGKTHLLQGLARAWLQSDEHADQNAVTPSDARVAWFDAHDPLPWAWSAGCSLVVVDNCDVLSAQAQHAAFVLFTEAVTHGAQFAAAGRLPPTDLPLRDDLRTRLGWGHVFQVHPLGEEDTRLALLAEAQRRGFELPADVLNHLLTRFARDLGSLMGLVEQLDHHALATSRRLTVPLVRDMLAQNAPPPAFSDTDTAPPLAAPTPPPPQSQTA